jgi:hypothetical protein
VPSGLYANETCLFSVVLLKYLKIARSWLDLKDASTIPILSGIAIALLTGVTYCTKNIFDLAAKHWNRPILYHDTLYLAKASEIELTQWLVSQHNEHRLLFSKLTTLIESSLGLSLGQSALIQTSAFLMLAMLTWSALCANLLSNKSNFILTTLAGWLIILNPWQYENLIWEFQPTWFLINVVVLSGALILSLSKEISSHWKMLVLICTATLPWIALFSSGQGIAFCLAFSICAVFRSQSLGLVASASSGLALVTSYRILPYIKPEHHPELQFDIDFFSQILLGGRWQGLALMIAIIVGVLAWHYPTAKQNSSFTPIIFLCLFSLLFAGMITLSRSAFGLPQADASRYVTHSLILGLAALLALSHQLDHCRKESRLAIGGLIVVLTTLFSFPQRFTRSGIRFGQAWKDANATMISRRKNFICHANILALKKRRIDVISGCATEFEDQDKLIDRYLSGRTSIQPTGWHQTLIKSPIALEDKDKQKAKIKYNLESQGLSTKALEIRGWAFMDNKRMGSKDNLHLLAFYGNKPGLLIPIDQLRPDVQARWKTGGIKSGFEAVIPRVRNGQTLTSVRIVSRKHSRELWIASALDP